MPTALSLEEYEEELVWETRLDVQAERTLPWDTQSPVSRHMAAEGVE